MLRKTQIVLLTLLGAAMWAFVTFQIKSHPEASLDTTRGLIGFITAPIVGFLSVRLCKAVGRLSPEQILPGVSVVGAVAMMMDGAALQWFSGLYGFNEKALRLSAAGLLWGYGVAFAAAVIWVAWLQRKTA